MRLSVAELLELGAVVYGTGLTSGGLVKVWVRRRRGQSGAPQVEPLVHDGSAALTPSPESHGAWAGSPNPPKRRSGGERKTGGPSYSFPTDPGGGFGGGSPEVGEAACVKNGAPIPFWQQALSGDLRSAMNREERDVASITGLTIVKTFTYRGNPLEQFSNTYWFGGPPPGDATAWKTLADQLIGTEHQVYDGTVGFVAAYGYGSDNPADNSVWSYDYAAAGETTHGIFVPPANPVVMAGDQAAMCEWLTDRRSSKGKPVYLRKFLHHGYLQASPNQDQIEGSYRSALGLYAIAIAGFHGGLRGQLHSCNIEKSIASIYVTTRTLKRRGKRPLAH